MVMGFVFSNSILSSCLQDVFAKQDSVCSVAKMQFVISFLMVIDLFNIHFHG